VKRGAESYSRAPSHTTTPNPNPRKRTYLGQAGQGRASTVANRPPLTMNDQGMEVRPPLGTVSNARVSRTNTV
jgi:hypothetical protein